MAKIIVELTRYRGHKEQYVFASQRLTIGRGYDNDIIIPDPYVSASHAVLSRGEGNTWQIEDAGSENGIFIGQGAKRCPKADIASGDEIVIGKTTLRVFYPSHPVEPAKRLIPPDKIFRKTGRQANGWILLSLTFFSYALLTYLESPKKVYAAQLLLSGIAAVVAIVISSGIWAFIGHLIKSKSRFINQISVFSMFSLSLLFINELVSILGYLLSSSFVVMAISAVIIPFFISILLMSNLYIATNISFLKRAIVSAGIGLCISIIVFLMHYANVNEFSGSPKYFHRLKPPLIKIIPSKTTEQFLQKSNILFVSKIQHGE